MLKKCFYFFILSLIFKSNLYSQNNDNWIKNDIVKFLYDKKEISEKDLVFLVKNSENKLNILLFFQELKLNCDSLDLRIFKFGTSTEHSKEYLLLLKGRNEKLFLGEDFKNELEQNAFYNFIKFYNPEVIFNLYEKIYCEIICEIYKHNNDIIEKKTTKFIEVYKSK